MEIVLGYVDLLVVVMDKQESNGHLPRSLKQKLGSQYVRGNAEDL
jgi:hypothetical protein